MYKRCLKSLVIKEIQLKRIRYHFAPMRLEKMKSWIKLTVGGNPRTLLAGGRLVQPLWRGIWHYLLKFCTCKPIIKQFPSKYISYR